MFASWRENYDKASQCIKKQIHHFACKSPYSWSYGLSNSHVQMENWMIKKAECQRIDALNYGAGEDSQESIGQQEDHNS